MPRIELVAHIDAPRECVFDLARSVDLHMASTAATEETAVAGVRNGLMGLGNSVPGEPVISVFGTDLPARLPSSAGRLTFVTQWSRAHFVGSPCVRQSGKAGEGTVMYDVFDFSSP